MYFSYISNNLAYRSASDKYPVRLLFVFYVQGSLIEEDL